MASNLGSGFDAKRRALFEKLLQQEKVGSISTSTITRRVTGGSIPLSFAQERSWFLDQLEPDSAVYNMPIALHLDGKLDAEVLRRSLEEVVRRHEVLRTRFEIVGDSPFQVVEQVSSVEIPVIDLTGLPQHERVAEAMRLCTSAAKRPFDLQQAPMLRATLFRLAPTQHLLFLNLHHIAADGWSIDILLRELGRLYGAYSSGRPSPLDELPIQYADFSEWQRGWLRGDVLEQKLSYWKKQLNGVPALLELPTVRPRPARQSYQGASEAAVFPKSLLSALEALSRAEGASLFMTLLAAFQTLLGRFSGQEDIPVGSPVAGRDRLEVEGLIGLFVNTLVLRGDLSGNPTFRDLLRRVKGTTLADFTHQDLPFEKLVEELRPERSMNHNPFFQTFFALQSASPEPIRMFGGLDMSWEVISTDIPKFPLSVEMTEGPDGLKASVQYCTDLFARKMIVQLLNHFEVLLQCIANNPDQRLLELPLLSVAEREQLLVGWNDNAVDFSVDRCVHELFEEHAARTPNAVAVVSGAHTLGYGELDRRANQLAHALRKRGVGLDTLVGIYLGRTPDMIVALLGILKAGGAYVPLDPDYPIERIAFMIEDCGAKALVTIASLRASLQQLPPDCEIICLDSDAGTLTAQPESKPDVTVGPSNLAYAIYTSGTTGRPKAALLEHGGLLNHTMSEARMYGIGSHSRVLQFASLSFDTSLSEIAMGLCWGGRLYVEVQDEILPGGDLERYIERKGINVLAITPSALAMLESETMPSLKLLIVGGEACPADLAARWSRRCRFFNTYGPTEASISATFIECGEGALPPLIGRPWPNVSTYILNRDLQPVPVGVAGELCIAGAGVGRGYLNRPELTAQHFVLDPFSGQAGSRMYRSGDVACWREDGNIEYIGRMDDQVKIRGFRIELGEIEAVIARHEAVRAVVVLAREDVPGDKRLVAYVIVERESEDLIDALRASLKGQLPHYMVPSAFVVLDALPLTPNDKVDRKALPAPDMMAQSNADYVAPRTPTEEVLAGIWGDVLGMERVGIHDNFFELGGHSMSAVNLISKVKSISHIKVPLRLLFEHPTVAEMAQTVDAHAWSTKPPSVRNDTVDREEVEF